MSDTNTNAAATIDAVNGGESIIQEVAVQKTNAAADAQQAAQQAARDAFAVVKRLAFAGKDDKVAAAAAKLVAAAAALYAGRSGIKGKDKTVDAAVSAIRWAVDDLRTIADAAEAMVDAVRVLATGDQSPLKGGVQPKMLADGVARAIVGTTKAAEAVDLRALVIKALG